VRRLRAGHPRRDRATIGAIAALAAVGVSGPLAHAGEDIRAVDASFVPQLESLGAAFRSDGVVVDPISYFASRGVNAVRLRVWNAPSSGFCDVDDTLAMARRIHSAGMKLIVDFHYSDSWADPGQQTKPAAWASLSFPQLTLAVQSFTRNTVAALVAQGTPPDIVQIGNEITAGMLWNEGRVSAWNDGNWTSLATLLNAGAGGARLGAGTHSVRIMLHIDRGGDNATTRQFFDRAMSFGVSFDMIGLSYYPWWHGSFTSFEANIADTAARYSKPVFVAETAYPWTLAWADNQQNFVGLPAQLLPGFPATPAGQAAFLNAVHGVMRSTSGGVGWCYWAPEYGAFPGLPSPWENLAMFDFLGEALSSWSAFANPCPADLNGDWLVDDADFVEFARAYEILLCSESAMPVGCPSDLNRDAVVDDADFVLFARAYDALTCP
jgi:arabinogalactan endo-1,4-beta-galactosidase